MRKINIIHVIQYIKYTYYNDIIPVSIRLGGHVRTGRNGINKIIYSFCNTRYLEN